MVPQDVSGAIGLGIILILVLATLLSLMRGKRRYISSNRRQRQARPEPGTVYVLRDNSHPGIVKVGFSRRLTTQRRAEVSRKMAGGASLYIIFAIDEVLFPEEVERLSHEALRHRWVNWGAGSTRGQEWFRAEGENAEREVMQVILKQASIVRQRARASGHWTDENDRRVRTFTRTDSGRKYSYPFRYAGKATRREVLEFDVRSGGQ